MNAFVPVVTVGCSTVEVDISHDTQVHIGLYRSVVVLSSVNCLSLLSGYPSPHKVCNIRYIHLRHQRSSFSKVLVGLLRYLHDRLLLPLWSDCVGPTSRARIRPDIVGVLRHKKNPKSCTS